MTNHLNHAQRDIPNYNLGNITKSNAQDLVNLIVKVKTLSFQEKEMLVETINQCLDYLISNNLTNSAIYESIKELPRALEAKNENILRANEENVFNSSLSRFDLHGDFLALSFGLFYPRADIK